MASSKTNGYPFRQYARVRRAHTKWIVSLDEAVSRLQGALENLAAVLVSWGAPAAEPLADFMVPSREALARMAPEEAADWALALARAIFRQRRVPGAVTAATKQAGNAARQVKQMAAREAALMARVERLAA